MAVAKLPSVAERYRDAVENAVEGVFRTTSGGRFIMANRALAAMLGYDSPQQLMAERTNLARDHYVNPDDRVRFVQSLQAQGVVHGFEYEARHRDGSTIWLRDHARIVHDSGGKSYYEGTVQDITNQRRAERLLGLRARQQAAVARLGQSAIAGREVTPLLECATALVAETLDVEFSELLERRADGNLQLVAGVGWRSDSLGTVVPGGPESPEGLTVASEHPVIMDCWGPALRAHLAPHLRDHGVNSGVSVIVGTTDHPFGVLGAFTAQTRSFTVDDVNFVQGIASILAAAIVRLRGEDLRAHLLARALSAQEEERTRIARELHDETGQALSAILLGLRSIESAASFDDIHRLVAHLRDVTAETIRDVGRIARGLRPSTLDHLGLVPALQRYAEELRGGGGAGHDLVVSITDPSGTRLPPPIETTLYRIVQEALTNVARHAGAHTVAIAITRSNGTVRAIIADDGRGFDVAAALRGNGGRRSLGLVGMRERATLLGGTVVITSRPGGSTITVELPLKPMR